MSKQPTSASTQSTGQTVCLWLARLVAAGFLGAAAVLKGIGHEAEVDLFTLLGMEPVGRYLIGGIELLAATLILFPQTSVYGAFLGIGVMCGAVIAHTTTALGLGGLPFALLVMAACVLIIYIRRHDAKFLRNLWDR